MAVDPLKFVRRIRAVNGSRAVGGHFDSVGTEQIVEAVKVVGTFVQFQTVGVFAAGVPAAEVTGPVFPVEHIGVFHAEDFADGSLGNHFFHQLKCRIITGIVAGGGENFRIAFHRFGDFAALLKGDAERFFHDAGNFAVKTFDHIFRMGGIDGGNDDRIRGDFFAEKVKIRITGHLQFVDFAETFHFARIAIHDPGDGVFAGKFAFQNFDKCPNPGARSDKTDF